MQKCEMDMFLRAVGLAALALLAKHKFMIIKFS